MLANRVHAAMVAADVEADAQPRVLEAMGWSSIPIQFAPRADLDLERLTAIVQDAKQSLTNRNRDAMAVSWLRRLATKRPILLGRLDLGAVSMLHLPAETFVEYQLEAQTLFPDRRARSQRPRTVMADPGISRSKNRTPRAATSPASLG